MENKACIIIKHLHASFATLSGRDEWMYLLTSMDQIDFKLIEGEKIMDTKNLPEVKFETIKEIHEDISLTLVYLDSDKTFFNIGKRMIGQANPQEMADLVKSYIAKGRWENEQPAIYKMRRSRELLLEKEKRKIDGHVIIDFDSIKDDLTQLQGGLSSELFNHPYIQAYLKGAIFGYIGHYDRKFSYDRIIEHVAKCFKWSNLAIAILICSREGRYICEEINRIELDGINTLNGIIENHLIKRLEQIKTEPWFILELKANKNLK